MKILIAFKGFFFFNPLCSCDPYSVFLSQHFLSYKTLFDIVCWLGWERSLGEMDTSVCMDGSPAVYLKLSQHCLLISYTKYKINEKFTKIITFDNPVGGQLCMDILSLCSIHYESTPLKQHKTQIQLALVCQKWPLVKL